MAQPDPALGVAANFPSATTRNALLFAMQMGQPDRNADLTVTKRVVFVKKSPGRRYFLGDVEQFQPPVGDLRLDRDGRPLNPEVRVEQTPDIRVAVDCGIELTEATADEMPVGNFRPVKATITLMEPEYQQIQGCRELSYNNDRYGFSYELDATGLFDLTFHTLIFFAINES